MNGARTRVQARWELGLLLRNGEQLLLTLVIPVGLLLMLAVTDLMPAAYGDDRTARSLASVLTVTVISAAFTSLSIATAFERRSGALRFLGTTPLTRSELLLGKAMATTAVLALSAVVTIVTALVIGWRPAPGLAWALVPAVLGPTCFAAWGMVLAGALRAEAVLAVANGVFLALIIFGGVIIPAASLPGPLAAVVPLLPSGALAEQFTAAIVTGQAPSAASVLVLLVWLAGGALLSARTFRWSS